MRGVALLIASTGIAWILAEVPARAWWGVAATYYSGAAALLCAVPAVITLFASARELDKSPQWQLVVVVGGMALRIVFVVGMGIAICYLMPYFNEHRFWLWVIFFYWITLTVEVVLLVNRTGAAPRRAA
jgi:hypothetical protein